MATNIRWQLLIDWMEKNDISRAEFAQELQVTEGAISHWINGRWSPQLENLKAISRRTGLGLDKLIGSLPTQPEHAA